MPASRMHREAPPQPDDGRPVVHLWSWGWLRPYADCGNAGPTRLPSGEWVATSDIDKATCTSCLTINAAPNRARVPRMSERMKRDKRGRHR